MGDLQRDLRYAVRMLWKSPGFATVAILTLALGIGASTAIFSVVNAVLLRPLPYPAGDRLVTAVRKTPGLLRTIASYPDFTDWLQSGVFEKSAASVGKEFFLETPEGPLSVSGRRVTEEFFDVLGVRPTLGRGFLAEEVQRGESVAVISDSLWRTQLGGNPDAIGTALRLKDQVLRVVGVLPPDFLDPINALAPRGLYVPLTVSDEERVSRNSQWLQLVGRLQEGLSLEQASARMEAISARAYQEMAGRDVQGLAPFTLVSLREHQVGHARPALWLLLGAVAFVLLIACANVSNLLLARITARRHELAVRAAVGATSRRLSAQLMTESLLLSLTGGALALVFALWLIDLVKTVSPVSVPRIEAAGLDPRVFGFTVLTAIAAGFIFGLVPMLRGARQDLSTSLRESGGTGGATHARSAGTLVVAQVALTMILLVGATLATTSLWRLLRADPGFHTDGILTVSLGYAGAWKQPQQNAFFEALIERVHTLPGVRLAGAVDNLPLSGSWSQFNTRIGAFAPGSPPDLKERTLDYQQAVIGGDYLGVMGIPLKAGRLFDGRDAAPGSASVIVSESLAKEIWGDADPVGQRVSDGQTLDARVVGVVGDIRHFGPDAPFARTLYRPLQQREAWGVTLVVLGDVSSPSLVPAIRESVRRLDRAVILKRVRAMDDLLMDRAAAPRFLAVLLGGFGATAVLLAAIGLYGVLAYSVSRRRREIGVRVALGAESGRVLWMVIRSGMALAGIGVALGLLGALALSRLLRQQLFEVSPTDPAAYAAAALMLLGIALLACYLPARRATKLDPIVALRCE